MAVVFRPVWKDKDAKEIYTDTLKEIEREITGLEELRDGIKANLSEL